MSSLKKITLGLIGTSFMFAADAAGFAPIGAGMVVIGAGVGIGMFASAAANSISRQPEAAKDITGAIPNAPNNLPNVKYYFVMNGEIVMY